jgi:Glycosyl hydrolase family 26
VKGGSTARLLVSISLLMPVAAACAGVAAMRHLTSGTGTAVAPVAEPARKVPAHGPLIGVAGASMSAWNRSVGVPAALSVSYVSMARPVAPSFMHWVMVDADGATPVIEILPRRTTLADIATGQDDGWFRDLDRQITSPVVLSFAPEADGNWYSWGQQPAMFIQAWRHVHAVFGTRDVTWLWQMSAGLVGARADLARYWPGSRYVNWAGLDGYFEFPYMTFGQLFGQAITKLRKFTHAPVLLSEAAVGPGAVRVAADIRAIFAGIERLRLLGLIWFNRDQHRPPFHQDWNLQNRPPALAAFRQAARKYLNRS